MRITNSMLVNSSIADMNKNLERMQKVQQQMTSGVKYQQASDNPTDVTKAMQLNTSLSSLTQYKTNITNTSSFLDTTDTALGQAGEVLQNIRQQLVSAGTAGVSSSDLAAIKDTVNQDIAQFADILNTKFGNSYVFGGTSGNSQPVKAVDIASDSDTESAGNTKLVYCDLSGAEVANPSASLSTKMKVSIAEGVTVSYSATATDIMSTTGTTKGDFDLKQIFSDIVNNLDGKVADTTTGVLSANSTTAATNIAGIDLSNIDTVISKLLAVRAQVGATKNRMTSALDQNDAQNENVTSLLTKTQGTDITAATIQFASLQSVYLASIQASAKIIQPTLMEYLT